MVLALICDLAITRAHRIVEIGMLDEPAHFATAGTVLLAVCSRSTLLRRRREVLVVLLSAVAIDVDHVPLYLGLDWTAPAGRPVSHSLATVVLVLLLAAVIPSRARRWPWAVACGLCLHFLRDIATGPGLSLLWPLTTAPAVVPYPVYAGVIIGFGAVATVRLRAVAQPAS